MLYIFTKSTIDAGGSRHRAFCVGDFPHVAGTITTCADGGAAYVVRN